jgi:hypothetical protein
MKITELPNLMVSIAVRRDLAGDLLAAGFTKVFRTIAQQTALTALYETKAAEKTPHLDIGRLGRTDATGNRQVDGGYLLFTAGGQLAVTPKSLVADLTKYGFHLAVVEVFEKEGEQNVRLRMTWSRNPVTPVTLTEQQKKVARDYFNRTFHKMFGFFNPESVGLDGDASPIKGSIVTLNFSGVMNAAQEAQNRKATRHVRMVDQDGHLRCDLHETADPVQSPGPVATAAVVDRAFPARCPERTPGRMGGSPR